MEEHTSPTKSHTPTRSPVTDRLPRPILKRKGTPGNSSLLGSARFVEKEVIHDPKQDMAASFLQFCAMCENQILTPCNSILYCSEACRRKDSVKPLTAAIITTTPISPPPSEPPSPRPVLSPRLPTGFSHKTTPSISIPADLHDHSSDLDPTEWKPKLPERTQSEAFRFLSRFHRGTLSVSEVAKDVKGEYTIMESLPVPSLGNTPTTTAPSSLSTSAGFASHYSSSHNGYDFNTRPLPTRQNRWFSFNGATPKGVDLVTPHVAPPVSAPVSAGSEDALRAHTNDDGLRWEKRKVMFATPGQGDDGLSILFAERK